MMPVHPIETSGSARQSHDRRLAGWRRGPVFRVPDVSAVTGDAAIRPTQPAPSLALLTLSADNGPGAAEADQASQAFIDNVARVMRAPQRITGWFVDLII